MSYKDDPVMKSKAEMWINSAGNTATNKEIVANLFEVNNWDGGKIHDDWHKMNYFARTRTYAGYHHWIFTLTTGVSFYQCMRFKSLSKTGKILAPTGFIFGLAAMQALGEFKRGFTIYKKHSTGQFVDPRAKL